MIQYISRRLLAAIPMLIGAMSLVFLAMRVLPGDPCMAMLGEEATREALRDCTRQLGLDRPLYVQYADYLYRSLQFDFGRSLRFQYAVSDYLWLMFPQQSFRATSSFCATIASLSGRGEWSPATPTAWSFGWSRIRLP